MNIDNILYIVPAGIILLGLLRLAMHVLSTKKPPDLPYHKLPPKVRKRLHSSYDEQDLSHTYTCKHGKYTYYWDGHNYWRTRRWLWNASVVTNRPTILSAIIGGRRTAVCTHAKYAPRATELSLSARTFYLLGDGKSKQYAPTTTYVTWNKTHMQLEYSTKHTP